MNVIITKDCFWCGAKKVKHVLKRTFPEYDGKGGLIIKKEYVCSCCEGPFVTN